MFSIDFKEKVIEKCIYFLLLMSGNSFIDQFIVLLKVLVGTNLLALFIFAFFNYVYAILCSRGYEDGQGMEGVEPGPEDETLKK